MTRPRLLDLFCGAGGAAMGYHRAGFDMVGVDIKPQPHYPFAFIQDDALLFLGDNVSTFDAIHASPPCQRFSKSVSKRSRETHPDYIAAIRYRLVMSGLPYVIENVPRAPLREPITLCGSSFGLGVMRHRLFESSEVLYSREHRHQDYPPQYAPAWNRTTPLRFRPISGGWTSDNDHAANMEAMGVDWEMTPRELSESIPPDYAQWIGRQMLSNIMTGGLS